MNRHLRESAPPLLAFALMFACAVGWALGPRGASAAAEAAGRAQEPKGAAQPEVTVYGRAVYEGSGRPVRRARVTLLNPALEGRGHEAATDARGEFRFRGVRPGRYFVAVDQPGLLSPVSLLDFEELRTGGSYDAAEVGRYFDVFEVDGKADKEVTARARRGAAITGRVTYADGEPAPGITVHVMRRSGGQLVRIVTGMSRGALSVGVRTDDRGLYRASGLPPGEYVLAVSEAASLRVRVVGADKRPAPRAYVVLAPPDPSKWAPYAQQSYCLTDAEGSCEIGAQPGEYAVLAYRLSRKGVSDEEVKSLVASAPRVTLRLGEPKTLDLTLTATR
ncbi:MAG TPA: carboxypeptidase-like regulatory domain-containing protein [Pyrinomonadaceae bacterium]|nr:carboxypeptidase-like regulatory domain-containing protein [Pyrinomonadaceae bacterium]